MLSLDLRDYPGLTEVAHNLVCVWHERDERAKIERLKRADFCDLLSAVAEIEAEHRTWVAKDPANRHFGPPSPFATSTS